MGPEMALGLTRSEKRFEKRKLRDHFNHAKKQIRKEERRKEMIELGKTVIVTEVDGVKKYAFPPEQKPPTFNIPRLIHITEKTRKTGVPRKNRPGLKPEHTAALIEDASRTFAKEVDKAVSIPTIGGEPVPPSLLV